MRALVVEQPGGPEAMRVRQLPAPQPGPDQVVVAVEAALVGPRPPGLSAVEAAALPLAGATAVQLLDRLDPEPGEWVLVHGAAGGVGSLFVQLARARARGSSPRRARGGRRCCASSGRRCSWTATPARWPSVRAARPARSLTSTATSPCMAC